MAVFTGSPSSSTQYAAQIGGSSVAKIPSGDLHGILHRAYFSYTHTATEGSGTGEINLVTLPPGRIRIFAHDCRLITSQTAASSTMDVGYRAYYEPDGDLIAEDDNAFEDNRDTASAATDAVLEFAGDGSTDDPTVFNVDRNLAGTGGLIIFASVDSGNIEADDTIKGWITFTYNP
jgi:hypothetical protein